MNSAVAKMEIEGFVAKQPDEWLTIQGTLKGSERITRTDFAEKYASDELKGWLEDRGEDMALFIEAQATVDRIEFCQLLTGKWITEINERPTWVGALSH